MSITLEDTSGKTMSTFRNMDRLKSKHSFFYNSTDFATLQENLAALDRGLNEADLILKLSGCFSELEAENQLLKLHVKKLEENNAWVIQELRNVQNKLQASEQNVSHTPISIIKLNFLINSFL